MQAGDKLTLLREADDEGWYVALDARGKEGLVPTTHISLPGASVPASAPLPPSAPSAPAPASVPPPSASQPPAPKPATAAIAKFPYKAAGDDELTFAV